MVIMNIQANLSVNKTKAEAYQLWRRVEHYPFFLKHISNVSVVNGTVSEWSIKIPNEINVFRIRVETVMDEVNEHIGWQSTPGSQIDAVGNVKFTDAGKFGTAIHVSLTYHAPVGELKGPVSKLLNETFEKLVKEDLKNMKRYLETGEIPTTQGQSVGKN